MLLMSIKKKRKMTSAKDFNDQVSEPIKIQERKRGMKIYNPTLTFRFLLFSVICWNGKTH